MHHVLAQFLQRNARVGLAAEVFHARIRQRVFLRSQFRVVHGDGASHPFLPLREGQPWDFREDFGDARGWRVEAVKSVFNPGVLGSEDGFLK